MFLQKDLHIKTLTVLAILFVSVPLWGQVDLEKQRRLIEEFKQEQEAKRAKKAEVEVRSEPTKEGDLTDLKKEMADARLVYENDKSNDTRAAVGQATINYVMPLIRLRDFETAVRALEESIRIVGGQANLSTVLVDVFLQQADLAVAKNDYYTANRLIHEAWAEAKASRVDELAQGVARRYRDFYWEWAQILYGQADWANAVSKSAEALAWRIETGPIDALMAQIHYNRDQYNLAMDHLRSAMRELGRSDETLVYLKSLIETESYLERSFRSVKSDTFILAADPNFKVDQRDLEIAFARARTEAEKDFAVTSPRKIRVSVYQRGDYTRFCESPDWNQCASIGGKLRLRNDAARGRDSDLEVMLKYAYGLWVMDVETRGYAPAWFAEGFAHQLAFPEGPPNGGRNELKKELSADRLPSFAELDAPFRYIGDVRKAAIAMAQSQSGFRFLLEKEGFGVVARLVDRMKRGEPFEVALSSETRFDYTSFFDEWRDSFNQGFLTEAHVDAPRLRALGRISPLGSYWER